MNKTIEYIDVIADTQKQACQQLLSAQKDLEYQMKSSLNKAQNTFVSLYVPGIAKSKKTDEALSIFNTFFGATIHTASDMAEEVSKFQEYWIGIYEKQLDIGQNLIKGFASITLIKE